MIKTDSINEKYIRELKALRQRIAESKSLEDEGMYKAVFDSAGDIILRIDNIGKIKDVNERLLGMGGYKKEEIIGKNIRTLDKIIGKNSLVTIVGKFQERMAGFDIPPYEVELYKANGELLTFEVSARPLKKLGKIIGDLVILRDVTKRK